MSIPFKYETKIEVNSLGHKQVNLYEILPDGNKLVGFFHKRYGIMQLKKKIEELENQGFKIKRNDI